MAASPAWKGLPALVERRSSGDASVSARLTVVSRWTAPLGRPHGRSGTEGDDVRTHLPDPLGVTRSGGADGLYRPGGAGTQHLQLPGVVHVGDGLMIQLRELAAHLRPLHRGQVCRCREQRGPAARSNQHESALRGCLPATYCDGVGNRNLRRPRTPAATSGYFSPQPASRSASTSRSSVPAVPILGHFSHGPVADALRELSVDAAAMVVPASLPDLAG